MTEIVDSNFDPIPSSLKDPLSSRKFRRHPGGKKPHKKGHAPSPEVSPTLSLTTEDVINFFTIAQLGQEIKIVKIKKNPNEVNLNEWLTVTVSKKINQDERNKKHTETDLEIEISKDLLNESIEAIRTIMTDLRDRRKFLSPKYAALQTLRERMLDVQRHASGIF
jgi:hypothetical protein